MTLQAQDRVIKGVCVMSLLALGMAWSGQDRWPPQKENLRLLYKPPLQTPTDRPPFQKERGGNTYVITPHQSYELYGLVVCKNSFSKVFPDYYHERARDFLNASDLCVVWGENVRTGSYRKLKYRSGSWTCYLDWLKQPTPEERWAFHEDELSNNHLVPSDERVNRAILRAGKGDQIHFRGYLIDYGRLGGAGRRVTSVTRDDLGCEIVYVTEFEILRAAHPGWRLLFAVAEALFLMSILLLAVESFLAFISPPESSFTS